jgi:hypothetical protein
MSDVDFPATRIGLGRAYGELAWAAMRAVQVAPAASGQRPDAADTGATPALGGA